MVRKLVSVDDDYNVPDNLNIREVNLPESLSVGEGRDCGRSSIMATHSYKQPQADR